MKHKTDFFSSIEAQEGGEGGRKGKGRSRKVPLAMRRLSFVPHQTSHEAPLVAPPPDTPQLDIPEAVENLVCKEDTLATSNHTAVRMTQCIHYAAAYIETCITSCHLRLSRKRT